MNRFALAVTLSGLAALALYAWLAGWNAKETQIDTQNEKAQEAADDAELNLNQCLAAGRVWIFQSGQCGGPL